jgi:hypothetical protein
LATSDLLRADTGTGDCQVTNAFGDALPLTQRMPATRGRRSSFTHNRPPTAKTTLRMVFDLLVFSSVDRFAAPS